MGNEIVKLIISLSISGTILGTLIFLVRFLLKKQFSKTWQYYIWILVLIRLMLPVGLPSINLMGQLQGKMAGSIQKARMLLVQEGQEKARDKDTETDRREENSAEKEARRKAVVDNMEDQEGSPAAKPHGEHKGTAGLLPYLWIFWLFGAVLMLVVKIVDYLSFMRYIKAGNEPVTEEGVAALMDDLLMDLKIRRNIPVYSNKLIISPLLTGLKKPFIVLPPLSDPSSGELRYILMHELIHYKRGDILYKWLFQLVICVHWFNPFSYLLGRELNRSCELSCDERVLKLCSGEQRMQYGNTLLTVADTGIRYRSNVLSSTLIESRKYMKERLKNIMEYKKRSKIVTACSILAIAVLALAGAVIGAGTGKSSSKAALSRTLPAAEPEKESAPSPVPGADSSSVNLPSYWRFSGKDAEFTAEEMYDNDKLICEKEGSVWTGRGLNERSNSFFSVKFTMSGVITTQALSAKEDTSMEVEFKAKVTGGKFKLVLIGPDNQVSILKEGGGNFKKRVPLKKGRSSFKLVGREAAVEDFTLKFGAVDKKLLNYRFRDIFAEKTFLFMSEVKSGKRIDMEELKECAPFLETEDLDYCIVRLLKQDDTFTPEDVISLAPFLEEDSLSDLMADLLKQKNLNLTLEDVTGLAPFLGEDSLGDLVKELLKQKDLNLTRKDIMNLAPFLEEDSLSDLMADLLKQKNLNLTLEDVTGLAPFLGEDSLGDLVKELLKQKDLNLTLKDITNLAPFLDEDAVGDFVLDCISSGGLKSISGMKSILPFMDSEDICQCVLKAKKMGMKLTKSDFIILSNYMDDYDLWKIM